ncbi:DUF4401 domain-containing protein [Verticiella sediminum]|uniref:DUF4401 domain-containing protein n=1 Tax=Verticiella sediminum TaxID=1247510 RepID=A0A556AC30_9BURK|nr:DUF4401 domain-containing protein [Verticiella sediminum]TSH90444.1 DUF4401 domain-containing protein [Verticiella sediminum]
MSGPADSGHLREALQARGWWHGAAPEGEVAWYVRLVQGVAAWLAACLLLPLFALIFNDVLGEPQTALGLAVGGCVVGCALMRAGRGGVFVPQLGTAVVLAGLAVAVGTLWDDAWGWWAVAALALASYVAGPVYVNRLLCGLVFALAFLMITMAGERFTWGLPNLAAGSAALMVCTALLWRSEAWLPPRWAAGLEPAAWAATFASIVALWFFDGLPGGMAPEEFAALSRVRLWAGAAAGVLPLLAWVAVTFVPEARYAAPPGARARVVVGAMLLLLIPVFVTAPGIALGVTLLVLGVAHSRLVLMAVGLATVLSCLARYYYLLHLPLLEKSGWLAVAGSVVLVAGMVLARIPWRDAARSPQGNGEGRP